jgi:glutamate--cysteine ligase
MTVIGEAQAAEHIHGICLKTGPPRRIGAELEWLVRDARDPALPVPAERIAVAVEAFGASPGLPSSSSPGVLPSGALLTTEPGGQLELSSLPADSLADCVRATAADLAALRAAAADAGLELAGVGLDPFRPPRRVLHLPRYAAMEAFFDRGGPWGREMMCATASVQVCLDAGDDGDGHSGYRWRWRLLHAIGPVLVAAFANSPLRGGRPTGWRSSRQQVWAHVDPGRTRPPHPPRLDGRRGGEQDADPRAAWAAYALDAQVMCVRDDGSADWSAPPGLTLRDWVRGATADGAEPDGAEHGGAEPDGGAPTSGAPTSGAPTSGAPTSGAPGGGAPASGALDDGEPAGGAPGSGGLRLRAPTTEDLAYHLSTLFPPVRPRGHFELRMIDAQPGDGWVVPLAVTSALLSDARAGDAAMSATGRLRVCGADGDLWLTAAKHGPADARLARASRDCFEAARDALVRQQAPAPVLAPVDAFIDRYVSKDRCPADDLLEEAE